MFQKIADWVQGCFENEAKGELLYGLIKINQRQMAELVKGQEVEWDTADGGWVVSGLEQNIFVPFNQIFQFPGRDSIFTKRGADVDKVLDRMEAGYPAS